MLALRSIFPHVRGVKFFSSQGNLSELLMKLSLHEQGKNKPSRVKDILTEVLKKSEGSNVELKPTKLEKKKIVIKSEPIPDASPKVAPVAAQDLPVKGMLEKLLALKNDPNASKLSGLLLALEKHTTTPEKPAPLISEIFSGIKVEKPDLKPRLKPRTYKIDKSSADILDGPGLDVFTKETIAKVNNNQEQKDESLYEQLLGQDLEKSMRTLPRNFFEEAIMLTKEGKLWNFPINNEQGIIEEVKVPFHQHVFLENFLKHFPKDGAIRHFMELVLVGLSKNPYLTVEEKKNHIMWFADYFKANAELA